MTLRFVFSIILLLIIDCRERIDFLSDKLRSTFSSEEEMEYSSLNLLIMPFEMPVIVGFTEKIISNKTYN